MITHGEMISRAADLCQYPVKSSTAFNAEDPVARNTCIVLGDLHGNALKLMHFLLSEGIVAFPEAEYQKLVEVYNTAQSTDQATRVSALKVFQRVLLQRITVNPGAHVRALGDLLCDRGANDFFTLLIIDKLINKGVNFEIILSNHDSLFIGWMESIINEKLISPLPWEILRGGQAASLERLNEFVELKVVPIDYLESTYSRYKSTLKLLSYDYNATGQLILHSHAHLDERSVLSIGIGLYNEYGHSISEPTKTQLSNLCIRLTNESGMISQEDTIALVDLINAVVNECASKNCLQNLIYLNRANMTSAQNNGARVDPEVNPVHFALWNRDDIDRKSYTKPKNPNIINAHGHHTYSNRQQHAIDLNNRFGNAQSSEVNAGTLTYLKTLRVNVNVIEMRYVQLMNMMQFLMASQNMGYTLEGTGRTITINRVTLGNATVRRLCEQLSICFSDITEPVNYIDHAEKINEAWGKIDALIASQRNPGPLEKAQRALTDRMTARSEGPKATTNQVVKHWVEHTEKQEAIARARGNPVK